jgi:3-mercaptopyruvate sulfurtransferase SseA
MHKTLIDPSTLAPHVGDSSWVIVDCRFDLTDPDKGEHLYREAHIPCARYAHLDRHLSGPKNGKNGRHPLPDSEVIARNFSDLGISAGTQVVAYDADSGMYAARLWWMLRWMGHDAVAVLDAVGGHIPGAANYFFQQNLTAEKSFKDPDDLKTQWDAVIKGHDPKDVVVYCGSGVTACHNLLALEHAGIQGVKIYPGSWSEWSSDPNRPRETE